MEFLHEDGTFRNDSIRAIGTRLRMVREQAGYTVEEMCGLFKTTEEQYLGIENGDYFMSFDNLLTIKVLFDIDCNWLICGVVNEPGEIAMYHDIPLGEL